MIGNDTSWIARRRARLRRVQREGSHCEKHHLHRRFGRRHRLSAFVLRLALIYRIPSAAVDRSAHSAQAAWRANIDWFAADHVRPEIREDMMKRAVWYLVVAFALAACTPPREPLPITPPGETAGAAVVRRPVPEPAPPPVASGRRVRFREPASSATATCSPSRETARSHRDAVMSVIVLGMPRTTPRSGSISTN